MYKHDWVQERLPELRPTYGEVAKEYSQKEVPVPDPTSLIPVDEADRLRMTSLEQVRAIFDEGQIGLILIGMPGLKNAWRVTPSSIRALDSSMSFARWYHGDPSFVGATLGALRRESASAAVV
jgi:hypothetical protein